MQATGAPVDVLDVGDDIAREIYGYDLLLVRPDLHVVWRGNQLPEDAKEVADVVIGHSLAATPSQ